jgi:hypothetical protein
MSSTTVGTFKKKKNSPYLSYEGHKPFPSPKPPDQLWGIPSLPGVKHLVHEANHTPNGSAKVRNEWNYTTNLQYAIMICKGTTLHSHLILSLIT